MSFLEKEIIINNSGKNNRMYTIYKPDIIKTKEPLSWSEFLSIIVPFLNKNNNKQIIYSFKTKPEFNRLYKNKYGQIESELIDYKQHYYNKIRENETIKLSIRIWYALRIKGILWKIFYNYKIIKIIMIHLNFYEESYYNINFYDIENVLTNIANS